MRRVSFNGQWHMANTPPPKNTKAAMSTISFKTRAIPSRISNSGECTRQSFWPELYIMSECPLQMEVSATRLSFFNWSELRAHRFYFTEPLFTLGSVCHLRGGHNRWQDCKRSASTRHHYISTCKTLTHTDNASVKNDYFISRHCACQCWRAHGGKYACKHVVKKIILKHSTSVCMPAKRFRKGGLHN